MARSTKPSGSQDLIGRISDTIAEHPRVSAAAAFQMGVLLGQAMQNAGALKGIGRKMAAAPGAIAASIPTFGLFDSHADETSGSKTARPANRRAGGRNAGKRNAGSKRSKRISRA